MATDPKRGTDTGWARRALTAAAVKIADLIVPGTGTGGKRNADSDAWIDDAWAYRDTVPQVMFAARFLGNASSRLTYFPAVQVADDGDVIAVLDAAQPQRDEEGRDTEPALISAALAAAAVEEFDRLRQSPDGLTGLQSMAAVNLTIGGEVFLIGRDTDDGETWFMQSKACVRETETPGVYEVNDPNTGAKLKVDARPDGPDFVARIWRRHPRFPWKPDSNIRAITDLCEEFLIHNRAMRAIGKSRNSAGILKIPSEMDQPPVDAPAEELGEDDPPFDPETSDDPPEDGLTDFQRSTILSFVTPTEDDGSAASVAPHMMMAPGEVLQYLDWIDTGRKIDPEMIARLDWIVRNMAQGVDLPPEILTGLADANHWTGWLIEDTTYKAHVEPLALLIAQGLATAMLRPALRERGFSADEVRLITVGVDPSGLVVRPNRFADANTVFAADGLSWEALRRYGGFGDDDAPTPEEMVVRYVFQRGIGGMGLTRDLMALIGVDVATEAEAAQEMADAEGEGSSATDDTDAGGEDGGDPTPDAGDEQPPADQASTRRVDPRVQAVFTSLVAAGNAQSDLGPRLASIDARLRERLQTAASAAMALALDRAGKRLRAAVQGNAELAPRVKGVDNAEVGAVVGDGVVDATELLSAEDFEGLHGQWTAWTAQAAGQAVDTVRAEAAVRDMDPARVDAGAQEALATVDQDRDAGWALLLAGLLTLGRARIFTPDGTPDEGEFDPNLSVPPGLVREALTTAGGGTGTGAAGTSGGPASGESMMRYVRTLGAVTVAWRWETGMPARPFHPHHQLAGVVFSAFDDPRLINGSGYPSGGYYHPGDHKGCQCDAVPLLVFNPEGVPAASTA